MSTYTYHWKNSVGKSLFLNSYSNYSICIFTLLFKSFYSRVFISTHGAILFVAMGSYYIGFQAIKSLNNIQYSYES